MKTYQEYLEWTASRVYISWERGFIAWKAALDRREVVTVSYIYDKTPYDVNQDVWSKVVEMYLTFKIAADGVEV